MAGTAMAGGRISAVTMDLSLLEQILCYLYYHGLSSPSRMRWRSDAAATNAAYQAIDGLYASWAGWRWAPYLLCQALLASPVDDHLRCGSDDVTARCGVLGFVRGVDRKYDGCAL